MLYLQQRSLLLGESFQLLELLQKQFDPGEDQQALLSTLREVKLFFASLHLLQCPPHRLHVGKDHLQVETENTV